MSTRRDDHIPEELYVSKAWLKKHGLPDIPEEDGLKIFDPFPSSSQSTSADPKLSPPPLTFKTLKKAIALLKQDIIIRFEVNTELFNEIVTHISKAKRPLFKLVKPQVFSYIHYDSIPIIHIPGQVEPLKIIKRKALCGKGEKKGKFRNG